MNLLDYVTKQLARTKRKRFEGYVIHRIIDRLDDFEIKFVTQQYVSLGAGKYGLTDLYFPQLQIHIEVDEPYHLGQAEKDNMRDRDIVSRSGGEVKRVTISDENGNNLDIVLINQQIEDIVSYIKEAKRNAVDFVPWDPEKEYLPKTYIEMGEIDAGKDVALRTCAEACNCFGHTYKGFQRAMAEHKYEANIYLWFPKLYKNNKWNNQINFEETEIAEEFIGEVKDRKLDVEKQVKWLSERRDQQRIVFAHKKDNLGQVMYRFMGVFKYDEDESKKRNGFVIWKRISTTVRTYPPMEA